LSTISLEPIDQALFGYADGHRQIASSFRLPPKDLYLLSSASDLASGTRLGENDSYLTGLPLPESRRYALFRTWAAPEMPRPGCVWSHTLLLDSRAIASLPTFSELLALFRRPIGRDTSQYGEPLDLMPSRSAEAAAVRLISPVIESYYAGRTAILSSDEEEPGEIERAILAIWSQQWPRLRASFSFCTASLNERRRSEINEYDVQVGPFVEPPSSDRQSWVSFAAADAAENRVTPLRRFLWRYGRDLSNSRRHYRMLVELFERSTGADEIPAEVASIVFQSLPDPSEGAVLKRDILGIGSSSPRLMAAISPINLLQLLTSEALPERPTPLQVRQRLEELTSPQIGKVARYYDDHREELALWKDSISQAIVALADKPTVVTPDFPPGMLAEVLLARADLIHAETLRPLTNDVLDRLLRGNASPEAAERVISEMLRRDLGETEGRILDAWPVVAFRCAIEAFLSRQLDQSWLRSIPRHGAAILGAPWLEVLSSTTHLAAAFAILRYPRDLMKTTEELSRRLSELNDDVQETERTNMQAVLLRAAIDESSAESWRLLSFVLPELRAVVIQGGLSNVAHAMLTDDLPRFYSAGYWDLNKRILLSLSKLYKIAPNDDILNELRLSPPEAHLVVFGEEQDRRNPLTSFWDWF
jgi:hypothetical protein